MNNRCRCSFFNHFELKCQGSWLKDQVWLFASWLFSRWRGEWGVENRVVATHANSLLTNRVKRGKCIAEPKTAQQPSFQGISGLIAKTRFSQFYRSASYVQWSWDDRGCSFAKFSVKWHLHCKLQARAILRRAKTKSIGRRPMTREKAKGSGGIIAKGKKGGNCPRRAAQ